MSNTCRRSQYSFISGRPSFESGQPGFKPGRPSFKSGEPGFQSGRPRFKSGFLSFKLTRFYTCNSTWLNDPVLDLMIHYLQDMSAQFYIRSGCKPRPPGPAACMWVLYVHAFLQKYMSYAWLILYVSACFSHNVHWLRVKQVPSEIQRSTLMKILRYKTGSKVKLYSNVKLRQCSF